jgi:copper chaperone CopZ
MAKKIYKVNGMDCASCAAMIEIELEDIGVSSACNYAKETLHVEFDDKRINEHHIKEAVKKAGYDIIPS